MLPAVIKDLLMMSHNKQYTILLDKCTMLTRLLMKHNLESVRCLIKECFYNALQLNRYEAFMEYDLGHSPKAHNDSTKYKIMKKKNTETVIKSTIIRSMSL